MKQFLYHIYHNPRCSKSIKAVELLSLKTDNYKVIKYLEVKIDKRKLKEILKKIDISSNTILRKNEQIYKNLDIKKVNLSLDKILDIIVTNPILLQRPIIAKYEYNELKKAMIARPPEQLLTMIY